MTKLVVCSQDLGLQSLLAPALGKEFRVTLELNGEKIREMAEQSQCDVVLLDLDSRCASAETFVELFQEITKDCLPIVLLTDDELLPTAADLVQEGAFGYCSRTSVMPELTSLLIRASEQRSLKRETADQSVPDLPACDKLIGSSPQMRGVYDLVRRVADLDASILINGESGTGKELVARAIHNLGNRAKKPFVAVSCGAIPETLIESELFGHEKGAYTGSAGTREGYLEQAGDGTLFLDEIGELSLQIQVKLLRVLQQREFSRLGSTRLIPLRARVVFATHRDLRAMLAEGKFRQDLYYRINVMKIECPALEERPEDIPALAYHFLRQYSQQYKKPIHHIEPESLAILENYSWPGNVRELENVIQRAIILAEGDSIRPLDLPEFSKSEPGVVSIEDYLPDGSFERLLRDYKTKLATAAVQEHHGNKTLAARSLGISRAYLHRLLRAAEHQRVGVARAATAVG
jgi:DNA-binding NtrC family response regulator